MSNFQQRNYYKIFTGTNQSDGYENVHLGYEAYTNEVVLTKDLTTFFHVPYFAKPQKISESTLVGDGAIPGVIPALADKIFKKQGGYGKTTPWGSTSDPEDGTWLCTWFYAEPFKDPQWLDRYYNPGILSYKQALEGKANIYDYQSHSPVYYDVPSTLTLEPGVMYQYFHNGEKSAIEAVETFAGNDKNRLRLSIDNWSINTIDNSIYKNTINFNVFNQAWLKTFKSANYTDRNTLSFYNSDLISCNVDCNPSYNLINEFTLSFWLYNNDWSNATNTQLIGNFRKGGYGIFFNNLYNNPFYVIPETTYGHLFYFNQEGNTYYDLNLEYVRKEPVIPIYTSINSESEVVILDSTNKRITKYDYNGNAIAYSKTTTGDNFALSGTPALLILDGDDNIIAVTDTKTFIFDKDLIYQEDITSTAYYDLQYYKYDPLAYTAFIYGSSFTNYSYFDNNLNFIEPFPDYTYTTNYTPNDILAFDINGKLHITNNCYDSKFDSRNKHWTIQNANGDNGFFAGQVYVDGEYWFYPYDVNQEDNYAYTPVPAVAIAVAPNGDIWVLAGSNQIHIFDKDDISVKHTYLVGEYYHTQSSEFGDAILFPSRRNISFINEYNRKTNKFTWYAVIYHDYEKYLYQITLDGEIKKATYLPQHVNTLDPITSTQDNDKLTFKEVGDFTGYEQRRIFNPINYNNNTQLQFKVSVKPSNINLPYSTYKLSIPVEGLVNFNWHLITATFKDKTLSLYIDKTFRGNLLLPDNVSLNYDFVNNLYIGTPAGEAENFNTEIASTSVIWNGGIDSIKIYDYAIDPKFLEYFIREKTISQDIVWDIPTGSLQYIETIDRFFKHRLPGSKSAFFNIKITGTHITDSVLRNKIENDIRKAIQQLKPAYTELLNLEWVN